MAKGRQKADCHLSVRNIMSSRPVAPTEFSTRRPYVTRRPLRLVSIRFPEAKCQRRRSAIARISLGRARGRRSRFSAVTISPRVFGGGNSLAEDRFSGRRETETAEILSSPDASPESSSRRGASLNAKPGQPALLPAIGGACRERNVLPFRALGRRKCCLHFPFPVRAASQNPRRS